MTPPQLLVFAAQWPEIAAGDDLTRRILESTSLRNGDIVVLTSKVVSKAGGRVVSGDRERWVRAETTRVVARRGQTVIASTGSGLVLAAAGVDASNTRPGTLVLLPTDADAAARQLRESIDSAAGCNVAVVISDTAGRAWRIGQTDIAIGCAGLRPVTDLRGTADSFGRLLDVTMPAIADELAAAADLVKGKASGCPLAVVRGMAATVLSAGDHGPGAAALIRDRDTDLFGLGAREAGRAVTLRDDPESLRHFPALGPDEDVPFESLPLPAERATVTVHRLGADGERSWRVQVDVRAPTQAADWYEAGQLVERVRALAAAHRLSGAALGQLAERRPGWRTIDCTRYRIA